MCEGISYIIAQFKDPQNKSLGLNIIACDSTTFKKGKRSPFKAELALVHWALTKEDSKTRGARKILVCSDAKSMAGFLFQDLDKIENERKQKMVEQLTPYNLGRRWNLRTTAPGTLSLMGSTSCLILNQGSCLLLHFY